jgi:hypothetical protein
MSNLRFTFLQTMADGTPKAMFFQQANDPTEIREGVSAIPVFLANKSLPKVLQFERGALFLAADLPPGWTNLQLVVPYCFGEWGGDEGIGLDGIGVDVPACELYPYDRRVKVDLAVISNDTRATPKANRQNQTPAKKGAALHSLDCTGVKAPGGTAYFNTIRRASSKALRTSFRETFKHAPENILAYAKMKRPLPNTDAILRAVAAEVDADKRPQSCSTHEWRVCINGGSCTLHSPCTLHMHTLCTD